MNIERLIFVGGLLHFGILLASALVPKVLDWKAALRQLDGLSRQLVWVHGAFIVLVIAGFGLISTMFAGDLAEGSALARAVSGFIAIFWAARLAIQLFVFDARPRLANGWLKAGYDGLTIVFLYHAIVYSTAAMLASPP